ncbi:hypothetical protein [Oceanobacillus luteolus]|uniref:Uncharacterized protein n=1 Tax=Oceanobacillus luteolus TaxID=1274358 RepID=A0ABW4HVZ8_9BACI
MRVFVLTDQGWLNEDDVFTPKTGKVKKNAKALPIKASEEKTIELKEELPMVRVIRGYYFIQCV